MDNAIIRAPIAKFGLAKIPLVFGRCTGNKGFDVPHPTVKGKRVDIYVLKAQSLLFMFVES